METHRAINYKGKKEAPVPKKGKNYLLAIGINAYKHIAPLKNAVKDATDFVNTLTTYYEFSPKNTRLITDEKATESNIIEEFRQFRNKVGENDNLVIYFSGHGHYDKDFQEGHWIPVDAKPGDIGDFISNLRILNTIKNIPSKHTFLVMDSCYSGSLFDQKRSVGDLSDKKKYLYKMESYKSRWGLASGRNEVVSDGEAGKNSPFTESLITFFKTNRDIPFPVSELVQHVKTTTFRNADQSPIGYPLNGVGDMNGEMVFYPKDFDVEELTRTEREENIKHRGLRSPSYVPDSSTPFWDFLKKHKDSVKLLMAAVLSAIFLALGGEEHFALVILTAVAFIITIFPILDVSKKESIVLSIAIFALIIVDKLWIYWMENNRYDGDWDTKIKDHQILLWGLGILAFGSFFYYFIKADEEEKAGG